MTGMTRNLLWSFQISYFCGEVRRNRVARVSSRKRLFGNNPDILHNIYSPEVIHRKTNSHSHASRIEFEA